MHNFYPFSSVGFIEIAIKKIEKKKRARFWIHTSALMIFALDLETRGMISEQAQCGGS